MTKRSIRYAILVPCLLGLALFGWFSIQVYRSKADPDNFQAWFGEHAWIVGPSGRDLLQAADRRMQQALDTLSDRSAPLDERIEGYRKHLEAAEKLLVRSLKAQPAQAGALTKLAAVRWELNPPTNEEETGKFLDIIAVASEMAPRVPKVQLQLGELLLKMGRTEEAGTYLYRAVELSPVKARDAVRVLRFHLVPLDDMLAALPVIPETLVALYTVFGREGRLEEYVELAETVLSEPVPQLVYFYGDACVRVGMHDRLLATMKQVTFDDRRLEAERLRALSRAYHAGGDDESALRNALAATELQPEDPRLRIHLGDSLRRAARYEEAIQEFRKALSLVARGKNPDPRLRADVYRRIGRVEDLRNRADLAFDAYKKAVELNPEEGYSLKRLEEMRKAAGVGNPSRTSRRP